MKIVRNEDYVLREIGGESFLVPVGEASLSLNGMITLNGMARFLWDNIKTPISREVLIEKVEDRYDVKKEEACEDMQAFLDGIKKIGLIEEIE